MHWTAAAAIALTGSGLFWAVQAQPVDPVCLEDPSAGCLAEAAALEFGLIDDAEIWQYESASTRLPNLAQILVETGRDEDLTVFLDKVSVVAPLAQMAAFGAAAAAFAGAGKLPQARALIAVPTGGGDLSFGVFSEVSRSMVRRGDVDGLVWLDTALGEIERSGAKLPHYPASREIILESVRSAELSDRLRNGGTENCAGIEPDRKIWILLW